MPEFNWNYCTVRKGHFNWAAPAEEHYEFRFYLRPCIGSKGLEVRYSASADEAEPHLLHEHLQGGAFVSALGIAEDLLGMHEARDMLKAQPVTQLTALCAFLRRWENTDKRDRLVAQAYGALDRATDALDALAKVPAYEEEDEAVTEVETVSAQTQTQTEAENATRP